MEDNKQCAVILIEGNGFIPNFGLNMIHFVAAKRHRGIYPGPETVEHFSPVLDEKEYRHTKGAIQLPYGNVDLNLVSVRLARSAGSGMF